MSRVDEIKEQIAKLTVELDQHHNLLKQYNHAHYILDTDYEYKRVEDVNSDYPKVVEILKLYPDSHKVKDVLVDVTDFILEIYDAIEKLENQIEELKKELEEE